jgi:thiosulfate dehydrogenase [quinone] large subunit
MVSLKIKNHDAVGFSYFIARWILGISFFNAAIWKIFILTPIGHTIKFFLNTFEHSWIPTLLLWALGLTIPFVELLIGMLLCLGLKAKESALLCGLLLIITTYGHSLADPLYNISQGLTFARLVLVLFLLIAPNHDDYFSLDYYLTKRYKT